MSLVFGLPRLALADVLSVGDRVVGMLDSVSRPSEPGHFMPAKDSNRSIAAIGLSVSNPILHTTDRWISVPGNQVLYKTVRFQGAVEHRVSNLRLQIAENHVPILPNDRSMVKAGMPNSNTASGAMGSIGRMTAPPRNASMIATANTGIPRAENRENATSCLEDL